MDTRLSGLRLRWLAALFSGVVLSGCASAPMALDSEQSAVPLADESVVLLRLDTANEFKPAYQPRVLGLHVVDRDSGQVLDFNLADQRKGNLAGGFEYWVSMRLPAGRYEIATATGISTGYNIMANFEIPLHQRLDVPKGKVIYLGRFEAVNVARTVADQIPAGGKLPLIPQTVAGYADGTFEVSFSERFNTDMSLFQARYPVLAQVQAVAWNHGWVQEAVVGF